MNTQDPTPGEPKTHMGKQAVTLVTMLYAFTAIGIAFFLDFKDIWPAGMIKDMLTDSQGMYPVKLSYLLILLVVGAVLFPEYWIVKKIILKRTSNAPAGSIDSSKMKEFSFSYATAVNTVSMDDMFMQIKTGFVTRTFLISKLRNYYLFKKNQYQTLYITYENEEGKVKKLPLICENDDLQFAALVAELTKKAPDRSLNHLTQAEAFKIMKTMNPVVMAVIVVAIVLVITAVIIVAALQ